MKKNIAAVVLMMAFLLVAFAVHAAGTHYTSDQVLNKVLDNDAGALKTTASIQLDSVEVNTSYTNTVFKRYTLSPNVDSDVNLTFGVKVDKWVFLNMDDTNDVCIKFDSPATMTDFKINAASGMGGDSKVTTIHAISADTAEVQAIGYYN